MSRTRSTFPLVTVAIAAATVIAACGATSSTSTTSSGSGDPPSHAQVQQMQQDAVRFADCMRSHGVSNFPDPTTSPREFKQTLDPTTTHAPAFAPALSACQHLLPRGGPRSQSQPPSHAQITAELAFAHCLRDHGFPNFPDPSTSGQLTHEMLASAGIDIHQPAAVQAADSCVSVTDGYITRANVAHFVAGDGG